MSGSVQYPFQLRPGLFVWLRLPTNFTRDDAERIAVQLKTIPVDETPQTGADERR